jgi:hypothetical protein
MLNAVRALRTIDKKRAYETLARDAILRSLGLANHRIRKRAYWARESFCPER